KEQLETGAGGLRVSHLMAACLDEFKENEDLPNTTNPDDWARISGKKGERIVYIRTLISGKGNESGRAIDTATNTGQYVSEHPAAPHARRGQQGRSSTSPTGRADMTRWVAGLVALAAGVLV